MAPSKRTVVHTVFTGDYVLNKINAVLKPFDLTSQQYNVLRILRGQKGKAVSLATIQERMINKSSNTTRLIDKLVKKRWVTREIDAKNRRRLKIVITDQGIKTLSKIDPLIDSMEEETTQNLTNKELTTLNELLEKLRD